MSTPETPNFNVLNHLTARQQDPNFKLVEFGHGVRPIVFQEPMGFRGSRTYTGIEDLPRSDTAEVPGLLEAARQKWAPNDNISFKRQDVTTQPFVAPVADNHASEVFASNVMTDPRVALDVRRSAELLSEMGRIVHPAGRIVLRETLTPEMRGYDHLVASAGLQLVANLRRSQLDPQSWGFLEQVYDGRLVLGGRSVPNPLSHYTILRKASAKS